VGDREVNERIASIEAAFPDAPPPPFDQGLLHLTVKDARVFRRTRWRAIVAPRLPYDAVYFFGDESYRYYLPALMVTALRWPRRAENLLHSTVSSLVPPGSRNPERPRFHTRMDAFSPAQRRAIAEFLEYAGDGLDALERQRAMRYWNASVSG
jgi:hypothetical protein